MKKYIINDAEILGAFQKAIDRWATLPLRGGKRRYKNSSKDWVKTLAKCIEDIIVSEEIVVFPGTAKATNSVYKKRKEFLFDIHAGLYSEFNSAAGLRKYISKSLIVVESEFSDNTTNAMEDLSKLLCCNSEIKIFIGPYKPLGLESQYMTALSNAFHHNREGILYIALIPHPKKLLLKDKKWFLFKVTKNGMKKIK